jgi:hypothetical protein
MVQSTIDFEESGRNWMAWETYSFAKAAGRYAETDSGYQYVPAPERVARTSTALGRTATTGTEPPTTPPPCHPPPPVHAAPWGGLRPGASRPNPKDQSWPSPQGGVEAGEGGGSASWPIAPVTLDKGGPPWTPPPPAHRAPSLPGSTPRAPLQRLEPRASTGDRGGPFTCHGYHEHWKYWHVNHATARRWKASGLRRPASGPPRRPICPRFLLVLPDRQGTRRRCRGAPGG